MDDKLNPPPEKSGGKPVDRAATPGADDRLGSPKAEPWDVAGVEPKLQPLAKYKPSAGERWEDFQPYIGPAIVVIIVLALGGWAGWRVLHGNIAPVPTEESVLRGGTIEKAAQNNLRSRLSAEESQTREQEATTAEAGGNHALALEKLREAHRLQVQANAQAATPEFKDMPRETRLARAAELAVAAPASAAVESARARGLLALEQREWAAALETFQAARQSQTQIVARFPSLRSTLVPVLNQLEADMASALAGEVADKVDAAERRAAAATSAGDHDAATTAYREAKLRQGEINERFPRSRFASAARAGEFEALRQTAMAAPLTARAAALAQDVDRQIRAGNFSAVSTKSTEALVLIDQIAATYPKSRTADAELRRRLEYLRMRSQDLAWIRQQVDLALAPLPTSKSTLGLTMEVPQGFYERVMNANPSRNASPLLPVESVSWNEAQQFCRRLSWLLGKSVRLPTDVEFKAILAVNKGDRWFAETSYLHIHPASPQLAANRQFQNVAGNVAEWLDHGAVATEAVPVAGGSFRDPAAALNQPLVGLYLKHERADFIGFRYVVETSVQ